MKESFNTLFNINPKYTTSIAFILGLILIDNLNAVEQNAIGEWLILTGQTIVTNSGFQMVIENKLNKKRININSKELKSIYNPVIYDIKKTKELLKKIYPSCKDEFDILSASIKELEKKINDIKKE